MANIKKQFTNEKSAIKYFTEKRWNGKITCPYCNTDKVYKVKGIQPYKCSQCRIKFTVKTGTIMEGSHIPVKKWLLCMYEMGIAKKGISSIEMAERLEVQQKTAWFMAQRIREACQEYGKLKGEVEIDEMYLGAKEKNKHAHLRKRLKGSEGKIAIVGFKERNGRTVGKVMDSTGRYEMHKLIETNVSKRSTILSDEHKSYTGISKKGYSHYTVNHSKGEYSKGIAGTNSIESVWATFKRGVYGTYHHLSRKHLQRYVNEFAFRLSYGNSMDFLEAVCRNHQNGLKYRKLIRNAKKTNYTAVKSLPRKNSGVSIQIPKALVGSVA